MTRLRVYVVAVSRWSMAASILGLAPPTVSCPCTASIWSFWASSTAHSRERSDYGRALLRRITDGDRLVRWSLRTDDIESVAARLGLQVERRERVRPDGVRLTWRAAGLALALENPWLPFFMQWDEPSQYPGASPARHPCGVTHFAWLEVSAADRSQLTRWTEGAEAPLRPIEGEPGLGRVALSGEDEATVLELP